LLTIQGHGFNVALNSLSVSLLPAGRCLIQNYTDSILVCDVLSGSAVPLRLGPMSAVVSIGTGNSGLPTQVATVVSRAFSNKSVASLLIYSIFRTAPIITASFRSFAKTARQITIEGVHFGTKVQDLHVTLSNGTCDVSYTSGSQIYCNVKSELDTGTLLATVERLGGESFVTAIATIVQSPNVTQVIDGEYLVASNAETLTIYGSGFALPSAHLENETPPPTTTIATTTIVSNSKRSFSSLAPNQVYLAGNASCQISSLFSSLFQLNSIQYQLFLLFFCSASVTLTSILCIPYNLTTGLLFGSVSTFGGFPQFSQNIDSILVPIATIVDRTLFILSLSPFH